MNCKCIEKVAKMNEEISGSTALWTGIHFDDCEAGDNIEQK